jgi:hypothetical protein
MVKETFGSDKDLKWNPVTKVATINGYSFGALLGNGYINSEGRMIVDSAKFAIAMKLSNNFGSWESDVTEDTAMKALRSEYANSQVTASNPKGFVMDPGKYYFLDYGEITIDVKVTEHTMHVSMVSGGARKYILQKFSQDSLRFDNAGQLATWLKTIYYSQYNRPFEVDTSAIAVELVAHAAPDLIIDALPQDTRARLPILEQIKTHSKEADIGEPGHERRIERILWDTLGPILAPNYKGR